MENPYSSKYDLCYRAQIFADFGMSRTYNWVTLMIIIVAFTCPIVFVIWYLQYVYNETIAISKAYKLILQNLYASHLMQLTFGTGSLVMGYSTWKNAKCEGLITPSLVIGINNALTTQLGLCLLLHSIFIAVLLQGRSSIDSEAHYTKWYRIIILSYPLSVILAATTQYLNIDFVPFIIFVLISVIILIQTSNKLNRYVTPETQLELEVSNTNEQSNLAFTVKVCSCLRLLKIFIITCIIMRIAPSFVFVIITRTTHPSLSSHLALLIISKSFYLLSVVDVLLFFLERYCNQL